MDHVAPIDFGLWVVARTVVMPWYLPTATRPTRSIETTRSSSPLSNLTSNPSHARQTRIGRLEGGPGSAIDALDHGGHLSITSCGVPELPGAGDGFPAELEGVGHDLAQMADLHLHLSHLSPLSVFDRRACNCVQIDSSCIVLHLTRSISTGSRRASVRPTVPPRGLLDQRCTPFLLHPSQSPVQQRDHPGGDEQPHDDESGRIDVEARTKFQKGELKCASCPMRPRISTLPTKNATATDSPVMVRL